MHAMCAPTSSQRRWNTDDVDGDDVPIEPRISHWHGSAATKHRRADKQELRHQQESSYQLAYKAWWLAGWLACSYRWGGRYYSELKK